MHKKLLSRKIILTLLATLAIFLIGFKVYSSYTKPPAYETVEAKKTSITQVVFASGEIKSEDKVELKFPISGKLINIAVKKNDHINKWAYIASLDKNTLQAQFEKARADWVAASHNLKLKEKQFGDYYDTVTKEKEIQTARAGVDGSWDLLQEADYALKNADIYSPIAGVVTQVPVQAGTSTIAGITMIAAIADPEKIYFNAEIGESDIASVSPSQEVLIELDAFPDKKFIGKVAEVDYAATVINGNKAYYVKIALEEKDKVKLDMSGEAEITVVSHEGALVIPKLAIQEKTGKKIVEVWEKGQVKQRETSTGVKGKGGLIEIISGLSEGDKVILRSTNK